MVSLAFLLAPSNRTLNLTEQKEIKEGEAKLAVFEYIKEWYNRKRLHSSFGYNTPVEIELKFNQLKNNA